MAEVPECSFTLFYKKEPRNYCCGRILKVCLAGPIQESLELGNGSQMCLSVLESLVVSRMGFLLSLASRVSPRKVSNKIQERKVF